MDVLRALRGRSGLVALVGEWCGGGAVVCCDPVEVLPDDADPFDAVVWAGDTTAGAGEAGFGGGWIGLWGYQLGRRLEPVPPPPRRPVPQAEHWFARYSWVLRQDADARWWFESLLPAGEAESVLADLERTLAVGRAEPRSYRFDPFTMTPDPQDHVRAVARAVEHIVAGDIFQANVCARLEAGFEGDPLDVFCAGVEALAPPYAAFLDTGDRAVVSLSPELFLRRRGRTALTAPIKGTAPAEESPHALAASSKNRAENLMIVDLMRNDLGRVCVPGTVTVPSLASVKPRAGVWHLVSEVTGELCDGVTDADLLRATFPPGSVTGAPKVRAMELINELESTGREVYTGAIGYVSPRSGLEASVVIRTLEFSGGVAWMGVGGGVVADSEPEAELAECYAKAEPVLSALGASLAGPPRPAAAEEPRRLRLPVGPDLVRRPDPALGAFTTMWVHDGIPVLAGAHVDRLSDTAATVYGFRLDREALVRLSEELAASARGEARLRLTVTPDHRVESDLRPVPAPAASWELVPLRLPGGLGAHKWADRGRLTDVVPQAAADRTDALLVDTDGTVLETSRANVFLVFDDGVHTPRADGRILPGVARASVLASLRRRGLPVHERDLDLTDLAGAVEVFVTNAVRGVVPVTACAGVARWPIGRTTRWLRAALVEEWQAPRPGRPVDANPPLPASAPGARVLLVDNYDSFAYNLAQYAQELGAEVSVIRNDARPAADLAAAFARGEFSHLVVSPGPGRPEDAGVSTELIRRLDGSVPVLGVCLGHQCIGEAYGARVGLARRPVHGKPTIVHHDGRGIFAGLVDPLAAARYHSLVVEDLPPTLVPTAWSADDTLMGLRHVSQPVEGIQVHPESILTPLGHALLGNFLRRQR